MPEPREREGRSLNSEEFEKLLKERRRAIWEDVRRELEKHEDQQFTDLIQQGADPDDRSVADHLVDLNLSEINRDVDELRAIDYALGRIEAGSYGICQSCGRPIGRERLRAIPETPLCIDCQSRLEEQRDVRTPSL